MSQIKKPMTWEDIVGQIHPEWPNSSDKTKQRIRNAAWGHGYAINNNGVVENKIKYIQSHRMADDHHEPPWLS